MPFNTLEEYLAFENNLRSFGTEPSAEMLREKRRLEEAQNTSSDEFIFSTMAACNKFMTPEKERVVRDMTEQLMSEGERAKQPCLLLGKVQCGKTDTFLSIMGLCFDRGIDIAIVMTKGTNTLTTQTIQRLKNDFRFFEDTGKYGQKVIIKVYDILELYRKGGLTDSELSAPNKKFIIVCKKENTNLTYLIELFEIREEMRNKKVLVCDDEADFASRAYYQRKGEFSMMRIGELIDSLIAQPKFCRYLQITATPYSLYLHPDGTVQLRNGKEASPWLPRYTGLVPIHDKYVGGQQYFVESQEGTTDDNGNFYPANMYGCLFEPVDDECLAILSARNEFYLESRAHSHNLTPLSYAIVSYMFSAAVRSIQTREKEYRKYYSSCLIHCEIKKSKHAWQEEIVTRIIEDIKSAIIKNDNADLHILDLETAAYNSLKLSNRLANKQRLINEDFPSFEKVEREVKRILNDNDYIIEVVNSEEPGKVETLLNEKGQLRLEQALNFFIGGSILDRGITIDNMLCFFYGRNPKKFQMDTVLQHARMYGARDNEDMACTRFFTSEGIYRTLMTINDFDECLYDYLKQHRDDVQSDDFLNIVIGYQENINPSARNKYTPANTIVIKRHMRTYPVGFQTIEPKENNKITQQIDSIVKAALEGQTPNKDGYYLVDTKDVMQILSLISSAYTYGEEYNNIGREWDINDMLTPLEYLTYNTDGKILVAVKTDRNLSRERENISDPKKRFIDAPESGDEVILDKENATDRPVLVLLRQNGLKKLGWRDSPFYWPVLTTPKDMQPGIFTVNGNKKNKKNKATITLDSISQYPQEEILAMTFKKEFLFDLLLGYRNWVSRPIKETTASQILEKDILGNYILVEGTDQYKYYDLSSVNDFVFPFEIKRYKYLHLRTSMDMSGSQAFFKLDEENPFEMECEPILQTDLLYNASNDSEPIDDESAGLWTIFYRVAEILEMKFTKEDEELYQRELEIRNSAKQTD